MAYDAIHYVSEHQRQFHRVRHPSFIIPNLMNEEEFVGVESGEGKEKVGGVIGSIDNNKQTHVSIKRALEDGCKAVFVFGRISEKEYYEKNFQ